MSIYLSSLLGVLFSLPPLSSPPPLSIGLFNSTLSFGALAGIKKFLVLIFLPYSLLHSPPVFLSFPILAYFFLSPPLSEYPVSQRLFISSLGLSFSYFVSRRI